MPVVSRVEPLKSVAPVLGAAFTPSTYEIQPAVVAPSFAVALTFTVPVLA